MDYSQFLHMREELSLVVVLLLLFLADLFMSPDAHKNDGKARLNTMLPVILMAVHTAINLIPGNCRRRIRWYVSLCPHAYGCQVNPEYRYVDCLSDGTRMDET